MTKQQQDFLWVWVQRVGILAGAVIAVATIVGFMWGIATKPIIIALSAEADARIRADSLLTQEIRDMRRYVFKYEGIK